MPNRDSRNFRLCVWTIWNNFHLSAHATVSLLATNINWKLKTRTRIICLVRTFTVMAKGWFYPYLKRLCTHWIWKSERKCISIWSAKWIVRRVFYFLIISNPLIPCGFAIFRRCLHGFDRKNLFCKCWSVLLLFLSTILQSRVNWINFLFCFFRRALCSGESLVLAKKLPSMKKSEKDSMNVSNYSSRALRVLDLSASTLTSALSSLIILEQVESANLYRR